MGHVAWPKNFSPAYVRLLLQSMPVGSDYRRAVVFVGTEAGGQFVPLGTGCIYSVVHRQLEFSYLGTAAHVVDACPGPTVALRINRKDGSCSTIVLEKRFFQLHPDQTNDIAVTPIPVARDIYDYASIDLGRERYATDRQQWTPSHGEEVVAIGLYTSRYGAAKNIPVVRTGHIASMLDEPVKTDSGYATGYLIEMRSIAGLSGSPVFGNPPEVRMRDGNRVVRDGFVHVPLGVLVGYHVVETQEDQIQVPQFQGDDPAEHTGFAVVIPIERVMEVLEGEVLTKVREGHAEYEFSKGYRKARSLRPRPQLPRHAQHALHGVTEG